MGGYHGGGDCGAGHAQVMTGMVAQTQDMLALTDAQKAPWDALSQAVTGAAASMSESCKAAGGDQATASAPQALDRYQAMVEARASALKTIRPAFDAAYAVLTDEQKATLDGFMSNHGSGMGMGQGMGAGMGSGMMGKGW